MTTGGPGRHVGALIAVCAVAGLLVPDLAGERSLGAARAPDRADSQAYAPQTPNSDARLDGEYGLWVREMDDTIRVNWLTRRSGPGFLRVLAGGKRVAELGTPPGVAHAAGFARPDADSVVIRYGGADDVADTHTTTLYLDAPEQRRQVVFGGVDSLFVVGDVHGEFSSLVRLLQNAGLVDGQLRWAGGGSHLVFLGDIFDRGPAVTRTLWFLYGLERQARPAGGRVHVVLGNHEIMVLTGDLRYVSPKERLIARHHGVGYARLFDLRDSLLSRWLATKPALIRIDDVLLAHGGVSPAYADYSTRSIYDSLATFIHEPLFLWWSDSTVAVSPMDSAALYRRWDFFFSDSSVFWYRGYLRDDTLKPVLARVLDRYDSELHVVGHTALETIEVRYGGTLIGVDLLEPASEMLLLVRTAEGWARYRYGIAGEPQPLAVASGP